MAKTQTKPKAPVKPAPKKKKAANPAASSAKKRPLTLKQQANQILKMAKERGVSNSFFFQTTFKRYQVQLKIMDDLEKSIKEYGATVTKEYVKGRENLVANPAISEYNKTSTAANGTVSTLVNIIKSFGKEEDAADALSEFLNG